MRQGQEVFPGDDLAATLLFQFLAELFNRGTLLTDDDTGLAGVKNDGRLFVAINLDEA